MSPVIRLVEVELLRRGPRHNQLLSPLTDYLAVCADFPAGVVNVPYEQSEAQNLLDELRYTVAAAESTAYMSTIRDRAGTKLAEMLDMVPGLSGTLATDQSAAAPLTHLRLVMSAAELALLPFEMAKQPVGSGTVGDDWLLLQPDRRVCLTRHVRGVGRATAWPLAPRILFITGDDVPLDAHLDVFERVLEPYRTDHLQRVRDRPGHWTSEHLTVIERASLDDIHDTAANTPFTHVHVLAHGAEIDLRQWARHGLALGDRVVTGGDLALALSSNVGNDRHLPSVVTLASCDSAAQGSLITPGGSVAHDLHAAGIPLVVGSQFPISEQASIPFTEILYAGQLSGEHPLVSITEVRRRLATEFSDEHAWASVVVYEALPLDLQQRLDELHYWQSRRELDIALDRLEELESAAEEEHQRLLDSVTAASGRLPDDGPFGEECDGLRAASSKRTAEVAFRLSRADDATPERNDSLVRQCLGDLEIALDRYSANVRDLVSSSDGKINRKVTLHWIAGQVLTLQAVLGIDVDHDLAGLARLAARADLDHLDPVMRGWAQVSLIEQAILELAAGGASAEVSARAIERAGDLVRAMGEESEHVQTTCRQMRRYTGWWGDSRFVEMERSFGIERVVSWDGDHGVVATASAVHDVLTPPRHLTFSKSRKPVQPASDASITAPAVTGPDTTARTGMFEIELLPARNGDCLWVTYGDGDQRHHVLIDCGSADAAGTAAAKVTSVESVELFVLTHIDADHITGAIPLFEDAGVAGRFGEVWFNGWHQLRGFLSVAQGEEYSALLERPDRKFRWNGTAASDGTPPPIVTDGTTHPTVTLPGGMRLTVLSPTPRGLQKLAANWFAALKELDPQKAMLARRARPTPPTDPAALDLAALAASGPTKDTSVPNLSSIAVLAEYGGRAVLLTGDAHADVLAASIASLQQHRGRTGQRLRLDALKLSHHGSANATTEALLDAIECGTYLVPTDGSIFYHPDREAIARVIVHGGPAPALHFNYRTDLNEFWDDDALKARYGYSTKYPTGGEGLTVVL